MWKRIADAREERCSNIKVFCTEMFWVLAEFLILSKSLQRYICVLIRDFVLQQNIIQQLKSLSEVFSWCLFLHKSTIQEYTIDVQYCIFLAVHSTYYISAQLPKCNKSTYWATAYSVYHLNNAFQTPLGSGEPPPLTCSFT